MQLLISMWQDRLLLAFSDLLYSNEIKRQANSSTSAGAWAGAENLKLAESFPPHRGDAGRRGLPTRPITSELVMDDAVKRVKEWPIG